MEATQSLFIIDRNGDKKNLVYGTNDPAKVPDYREPRSRRTLGVGTIAKEGNINGSLLSHLSGEEKTTLLRYPSRQMRVSKVSQPIDLSGDILYLSAKAQRKAQLERPFHILGTDHSNKDDGSSSSANEEVSEDEEAENGGEEEAAITARLTYRKLSEACQKDRTSLAPWVKLINYQDEWVLKGYHEDHDRKLSVMDERVTSQLKLSIIKDALGSVTDYDSRQILLLEMMRHAENVYWPSQMKSKWDRLVLENRYMPLLRLRRIAYLQSKSLPLSHSPSLPYEANTCELEYEKIILHSVLRYDEDFLSLTSFQLTVSLCAGGSHELAIAIWQALLELNLMTPPAEPGPRSEILARFQTFWDFELPRIGEKDATGWSKSGNDAVDAHDAIQSTATLADDGYPHTIEEVAEVEMQRSKMFCLPGKSIDDDIEDDTYRYVSFDDIRKHIYQLDTDSHKFTLLNCWLTFWGLPKLNSVHESNLNNESHDNGISAILHEDSLPCMNESQWTTSTMLFTTPGDKFSAFDQRWAKPLPKHIVQFVSRSLRLLLEALPENYDLAELIFAFELHTAPETADEIAKSILKTRKSSMRIYNAYVFIAASTGDLDKAESIAQKVLKMTNLPSHGRIQPLLLETLAILAVRANDLDKLRDILYCFGNPECALPKWPYTAGLRTRRALEAQLRTLAQERSFAAAISTSNLLALLAYIDTPSDPIGAALESIEDSSRPFNVYAGAASAPLSAVHHFRAWLIHTHVSQPHSAISRNYKPALLRRALRDSMAMFPRVACFPRVYASLGRLFALEDRIREAMSAAIEPVPTSKNIWRLPPEELSLVPSVAAIAAEQRRDPQLGGTQNAVRAAFERCVQTRPGMHCARIWTAWLAWEKGLLRPDASRRAVSEHKRVLRDLFARAFTACPTSMHVVLAGMVALGDDGDVGWSGVLDVVEGRGLRLRPEFEENLGRGLQGSV